MKNKKLKIKEIYIKILLFSALALLIFTIFSPIIFTKFQLFDNIQFKDTGQIGDTIGGIMGPFIGLIGIILTFLAFYTQFQANKIQLKNFKKEFKPQRILDKKVRFETHFFELLKSQQEISNRIKITRENGELFAQGEDCFKHIKKEIEIAYEIAKKHFNDKDSVVWMNEAYSIVFHGFIENKIEVHKFFQSIKELKESNNNIYNAQTFIKENLFNTEFKRVNYSIFNGYSSYLSIYYRHLFMIVKYTVYQDEKDFSYDEKRMYLRILRSQISNVEQVCLFYNWYSTFGQQWENENNSFLADYRMIHNIDQSMIINDIDLLQTFKPEILKEKNREIDSLFEFQDWKDKVYK